MNMPTNDWKGPTLTLNRGDAVRIGNTGEVVVVGFDDHGVKLKFRADVDTPIARVKWEKDHGWSKAVQLR